MKLRVPVGNQLRQFRVFVSLILHVPSRSNGYLESVGGMYKSLIGMLNAAQVFRPESKGVHAVRYCWKESSPNDVILSIAYINLLRSIPQEITKISNHYIWYYGGSECIKKETKTTITVFRKKLPDKKQKLCVDTFLCTPTTQNIDSDVFSK